MGMTPEEASVAYGSSLKPPIPPDEDERSCYYLFPNGAIGPVSFMVVDGRIARVDVDESGPKTSADVGVGSSESDVKKAYPGQVKVSPHPYTAPEGHYLKVEPRDGFAILFETDGTSVTSYRAGRVPAVDYIEGCL